jgi:hypothetical protein
MNKLRSSLLFCIPVLFLISCQKELSQESSGPGGLEGTWKFVEMYSKTESIVELSDGIDNLKTVTLSEYTSTENTGTLRIDKSNMTSTGIGYTIDTKATGFIYENNVLIDTISAPFNFVLPPSSSVSPYTKVSADSLYFSGGQVIAMAGLNTISQPSGVKLKFEGNKLLMDVNIFVSDTQNVVGIRQITKEIVKGVLTYQKL